jgi:hypothetical protein
LQTVRACRVADAHRLSELRYILWRRDGNPAAAPRLDPPGDGTNNVQAVPHLRFAVRNLQRQEIYSWTAAPARRSLAPGETLAFRSELALPPPDTRDVVVRFLDREDSL